MTLLLLLLLLLLLRSECIRAGMAILIDAQQK
jgi:hypothetical protein